MRYILTQFQPLFPPGASLAEWNIPELPVDSPHNVACLGRGEQRRWASERAQGENVERKQMEMYRLQKVWLTSS